MNDRWNSNRKPQYGYNLQVTKGFLFDEFDLPKKVKYTERSPDIYQDVRSVAIFEDGTRGRISGSATTLGKAYANLEEELEKQIKKCLDNDKEMSIKKCYEFLNQLREARLIDVDLYPDQFI